MQLANQSSPLSLALAADSGSSGITRRTLSVSLFSKYGHFCLKKKQEGDGQMKEGIKTAVHKAMGNITSATSIIYTVCGPALCDSKVNTQILYFLTFYIKKIWKKIIGRQISRENNCYLQSYIYVCNDWISLQGSLQFHLLLIT